MLITLALTDAGFRTLNMVPPGIEPEADTPTTDAPTTPDMAAVQAEALARPTPLKPAGPRPWPPRAPACATPPRQSRIEWDDRDNQQYGLSEAIGCLRAALAEKLGRIGREPGARRKQRECTKQQAVLAMLRREEGATVAQIVEATCWASHTARGFLAALKKNGIQITALERVRLVGPNKEEARNSYSVYVIGR